jgi:hypothetical protein
MTKSKKYFEDSNPCLIQRKITIQKKNTIQNKISIKKNGKLY